ncbi:MAG: SDR family NAD(P)-dependent oxidoreductase [Candidatus Binatia bacterium]
MHLDGKKALVTGGGVGVGKAIASGLARLGCDVAVNYSRSKEQCDRTASELSELGVEAISLKADVGDDAQARSMVEQAASALGGLDVLVNNAGTTCFVPHLDLEGVEVEEWDRIMATNVKGTFFCTRAAAPLLKAGEGGSVLNVSSVAGVYGIGSSIPYCASKAAVNSLTVTMSRVLAPEVRVNAVAPGFVDTRWWRERENYEPMKQMAAAVSLLKRVCSAEDVACVALDLIVADMVTGQVVVVDGGLGHANG